MITLSILERKTIVWNVRSNSLSDIKRMFKTPGTILLAYNEGVCSPIYEPTANDKKVEDIELQPRGDSIVKFNPHRGIVYLGIPDQGTCE